SKIKPVLDIGCGGGILSGFLSRKGYDIIGVDLSEGAIKIAIEHARESGLKSAYQVGSVYDLKYPNGYFSAVVCSDFLEHIEDLNKALSEISRVMEKGSPFVFDTISRDEETVRQFMIREKDGRIPAGTHDPKLFINPDELYRAAGSYGIEISENKDNPSGIDIKTMEDISDRFELKDISSVSEIGHYLGYGFKS
ncbi:MAG: methyltransferase domain-containing protein, partial [Candidatus Wildermuthbacteria bacterium]|nr:methyltransferase domain-containing protein [Candidatus Wildermuthbacteria bacterium]